MKNRNTNLTAPFIPGDPVVLTADPGRWYKVISLVDADCDGWLALLSAADGSYLQWAPADALRIPRWATAEVTWWPANC